jgi:hypothetical protein
MKQEKINLAIRLLIRHETLSLEQIATALRRAAHVGHSVHMQRKTPRGTLLQGVYRDTFWGWIEEEAMRKDAFACAIELLERFEADGTDFVALGRLGATMSVCINFFDDSVVADVLTSKQMEFLVQRGITLGVERFSR